MDEKEALLKSIEMSGHDIDCYILFIGTWNECSVPLVIIKELEHIPLLVWTFPMFEFEGNREQTGSLVGMLALQGALKRADYKFKKVIGFANDSKSTDEVKDFIYAASAKKTLRRTRIGLVGYMSMSMYPASFDHLLMSTLIGPEIVHFDTFIVIEGIKNIKNEQILAVKEKISKLSQNNIRDKLLNKAAGLYCSLKTLIERYNLDGINIKCQYELTKDFGCSSCIPLSMLADEGYSVACEGDIPTHVSMHLLSLLSEKITTYVDILDFSGKNIYLSCCGFAPFSLSKSMKINEFNFKGFKGIVSSSILKPGEITMIRLSEKVGLYELLYTVGKGKTTELRQKIMPAISVDLKNKVDSSIDFFSSQHLALTYGNYEQRLLNFASLMGDKISILKI